MIPDRPHASEKAQSGIGTLIILIAAILVATIAAGVFFDVAGFLGGETSATSEDVSQQLDGRLEPVSVSGTVSGTTIETVNVTVKLNSDRGTVDLRDATLQWVGSTDVETLTAGSGVGATFAITAYGGSDPVLDDGTDRATLTIRPSEFGPPLEASDVVTITLITQSETVYRIQVPTDISRESSVSL
jgi:flagellin-like protein